MTNLISASDEVQEIIKPLELVEKEIPKAAEAAPDEFIDLDVINRAKAVSQAMKAGN